MVTGSPAGPGLMVNERTNKWMWVWKVGGCWLAEEA